LASVLLHGRTDFFEEAAALLIKVSEMIEENTENHCYYCMVLADYYSLAEPDIDETRALTEQAERIARQFFPTELEIIDIIHIPTANCWFYHGDLQAAAAKLEEAVTICKKHPDLLPYIDKQAELLNCLLDVYAELQDDAKCRELIAEIDRINEAYREQGVFREVSPEIRAKVNGI
ncbi:MAG: serine/threonine protein kinase, partial [Acutalibacteraceae bacterium]|nr:serine/threonine protein kinase [Acutalibacteraceae bacterium]